MTVMVFAAADGVPLAVMAAKLTVPEYAGLLEM
jgi:hypothetical protein